GPYDLDGGRRRRGRAGGGSLIRVLERPFRTRPENPGADPPAERQGDDDRRRGAAGGALSGGDRRLRQSRDEPAQSERVDGDQPLAPHVGGLRPARAGRDGRTGARRNRAYRDSDVRRPPGGVREGGALSDRGLVAATGGERARVVHLLAAHGGGGVRAVDRLRERRQPHAHARRRTRARDARPRRARRRPGEAAPAAPG